MEAMDFVRTDLHGHTFHSDGRISPGRFVEIRAAEGLEVIALSDHDTFAGVAAAAARARELGVTLIPAMEATSFIGDEQVHVLAYFSPGFALETTALARRADVIAQRWRTFVADWERSVRAPLDEELALHELPGLQSVISRIVEIHTDDPQVAAAHAKKRAPLWEAFHAHHVRFWDDALFHWTPEELIDQIRADGGTDVVAHPNRVRDKERMKRVLDYATGVEVYTSRHNAEVSARFLDYATSTGKLWTASADDHQQGPYRPPPSGTPRRFVERLVG